MNPDHPVVTVSVPATSANLGPGLDTLGIAFNWHNSYTFMETDADRLVIQGVHHSYCNPQNLVFRAMARVYRAAKTLPKGLIIDNQIEIPFSRGFGSSAACILGGMLGANTLLGEPFNEKDILRMAIEMEGHPDNIVPAYYGGLVNASYADGHLTYLRNQVHESLAFFAAIPDFKFSTAKSRDTLHETVPMNDAKANIAGAALTTLALIQGDAGVLRTGMQDFLHQPYRFPLIKNSQTVIKLGKKLGASGVCLSGSGPSLLFVLKAEKAKSFKYAMTHQLRDIAPHWHLRQLSPDTAGTTVRFGKKIPISDGPSEETPPISEAFNE